MGPHLAEHFAVTALSLTFYIYYIIILQKSQKLLVQLPPKLLNSSVLVVLVNFAFLFKVPTHTARSRFFEELLVFTTSYLFVIVPRSVRYFGAVVIDKLTIIPLFITLNIRFNGFFKRKIVSLGKPINVIGVLAKVARVGFFCCEINIAIIGFMVV